MKYILLFSILLLTGWNCSAQRWHTEVGKQVPYFEIDTKDGTKKSTATLAGKVVLINFFATWCPPCRQELPEVQKRIWDKHKDREDFEIVVLAREEGWDKLNPFLAQFGYTFPFYPDLNRKIYSLFATDTIPRNVIIDRTGKIIYQSIGYEPEEFEQMVDLIQLHLDQPY
ncbi:TlpA family protein disulfide reductase [Sphingobacterium sp. lm-10]|uniref:TlpA family protein disulfide reductase n=1 Tax=Sphingobacterium sp. lm-10 TaxID=2944904 RepID=UPI0020208B37|nr:TlpA disulfide reductase family protein [Sphingobacterium sp. lm-10]MCL7989451.1 TlpA family protein disulfide reductase [Sphingobacterium sp. lm-10]